LVADGLDIVGVGIEDEGAVVAGVVDRAGPRGAVVVPAGGESGSMESVDELGGTSTEGDVGAADGRATGLLRARSPTSIPTWSSIGPSLRCSDLSS